jgi:flagellar protein FliJ
MKKFNFRLEKLLQLKAHIEKEKQKILSQATQKVVDQEGALSEIGSSRKNVQQEQRSFLLGSINTNMMSIFSRYYLKLKKNELVGREMLGALRKDQEAKRQELVKATRTKKIYEKLKERKQAEFNSEYQRQLQKEQDEIASLMLQYEKNSYRRS